MNSCISTLLSACEPPLTIFIIGIGRVFHFHSHKNSNISFHSDLLHASTNAIEIGSTALAQKLDLFFVQSKSIK
jgi:hypothetical protein